MKSDARTIAWDILRGFDSRSVPLDRLVEETLGRTDMPDKRERALVTTLVYGVLRWRNRLDWIIQEFSRTSFAKISPDVLTILRLGVFQLLFLDRIPDFAAVNAAVSLAKETSPPYIAGFVNGILRNIARNSNQLQLPDMENDPVSALAVSRSFPEWLLKRWLSRYGREKTLQLCDRINEIPPITVRVNTLMASVEAVKRSLQREVGRVRAGCYAPEALLLDSLTDRIDRLEAFVNGWIQVQDEAAQLVCRFLAPRPGEKILDACAGLGGKTACLAQLMEDTGCILAVDSDGRKLDRLVADMERLGITSVETAERDIRQSQQMEELGEFDRILADCPCSGLGVLRRNPDTKWSVAAEDLFRYHHNQVALLQGLAGRVRPGGVLLYVVCSREPEENEAVVRSFLNLHSEFDIDKNTTGWCATVNTLIDKQGFFKSLPYPHGMDGFFGVRLRKRK